MPDQPTIYFASRGKVLGFGALVVALGGALALPSWMQVQALLDGKPIGDIRVLLIFPGALLVAGVGLLIIVRGVLGRTRIILSDMGIECGSTRRRRFARWTSLGLFNFGQSPSIISAELIGPDADPDTIKAGKFTVSTLLYDVGSVSLLREIHAYHERAFECRGQVLPDPQPAPFDMGPPPLQQRSPIGSAAIVIAFDCLAVLLGMALAVALFLITKSTSDKTDISCMVFASMALGGFLGTRKWQVDFRGATVGSLFYLASVIALAEPWHPAIRHGTVLLILLLAVPAFIGLGAWRARSNAGVVAAH